MTREEKIEKVLSGWVKNGHIGEHDVLRALARAAVDALDEPVRVTDEMVDRALEAWYVGLAAWERSSEPWEPMRAAVEAALGGGNPKPSPPDGEAERVYMERLYMEYRMLDRDYKAAQARVEGLEKVAEAARRLVDTTGFASYVSTARLRAVLRDLEGEQ